MSAYVVQLTDPMLEALVDRLTGYQGSDSRLNDKRTTKALEERGYLGDDPQMHDEREMVMALAFRRLVREGRLRKQPQVRPKKVASRLLSASRIVPIASASSAESRRLAALEQSLPNLVGHVTQRARRKP